MKRSHAQHVERQWRGMQNHQLAARLAHKGIANSAEAVYWNDRYTPPPVVRRKGGHLRTVLAILLLAFGPPAFAYLGAIARTMPALACLVGSLLCCVLGLYLLMTTEENL